MTVWRDLIAKIHGLPCATGDLSACTNDRSVCDKNAGRYLRHDFKTCPVRATMDDGVLMAVLALENQAEISPLNNWPDGYAAWVLDLLCAVKELRAEKQQDELKRLK